MKCSSAATLAANDFYTTGSIRVTDRGWSCRIRSIAAYVRLDSNANGSSLVEDREAIAAGGIDMLDS